jgi:hypothetical protein
MRVLTVPSVTTLAESSVPAVAVEPTSGNDAMESDLFNRETAGPSDGDGSTPTAAAADSVAGATDDTGALRNLLRNSAHIPQ